MKPRILFVDDEPHMRDILTLYLQEKGLEVATAATGQQARELFSQSRFDLTVLDLNLAGEDGLDVLDFIKGKNSSHPVIIFTGVADNEALFKTALAGRADAVVRKMTSLSSLLTEIQKHLAKNSSTATARPTTSPGS